MKVLTVKNIADKVISVSNCDIRSNNKGRKYTKARVVYAKLCIDLLNVVHYNCSKEVNMSYIGFSRYVKKIDDASVFDFDCEVLFNCIEEYFNGKYTINPPATKVCKVSIPTIKRNKRKRIIGDYKTRYLEGFISMSELANKINVSVCTASRYMNEILDKHIEDNSIANLIETYNNGEFKDNDFTVGDWGIMTSQEKEPYLVTTIQWRTL